MKLTNDLIDKLLATENDFQFMLLIFENKIAEEEWQFPHHHCMFFGRGRGGI